MHANKRIQEDETEIAKLKSEIQKLKTELHKQIDSVASLNDSIATLNVKSEESSGSDQLAVAKEINTLHLDKESLQQQVAATRGLHICDMFVVIGHNLYVYMNNRPVKHLASQ